MKTGNASVSFLLRIIHNQTKDIICKSVPRSDMAPKSQLQGGIMGYLYHHPDEPVYQKDLEKEFRISRATATNTLQVMEKYGVIVRKSQDKDARLKRITLTSKAQENQAMVENHMKMMDNRMLEGLSGEDKECLKKSLWQIMANLEGMRKELESDTSENTDETSQSNSAE